AESRRQETEKAVDQILTGQGLQAGISRVLYLGQQSYATVSLAHALERSPDTRTKANIAFALSQFGVKSGESALLALLQDEDPTVRMNALQALAHIKSGEVKKIGPLLKDKNQG